MYLYQSLVIATVALLPTYLIRFSLFGIPTNMLELLIALCFLVTIPKLRTFSRSEFQSLTIPIIFITLFLLAASSSVVVSPHLDTSLGILKGWIIMPIIFGICVFFAATQKKVKNYIMQALILSGTGMALLGISQLGTLLRIKAVYDVPNSLALFLAPTLVMAVFSKGNMNKYFAVVMAVALLGTQSVSGIVAVAVTLLIGVFWGSALKNRKRLLAGLLAAILIAASYLFMTGRVAYLMRPLVDTGATNSISVRMQLWSVSLDLIQERPITGIGLGTFEPEYQTKLHQRFQEYESSEAGQKPIPEFVFRDPHNWILSFWLNTGLMGLISFGAINMWILGTAYLDRRDLNTGQIVLILPLLTILILGLTETIYWKNDLAALYWVIIALGCSGWWRRRQRNLGINKLRSDSI